MLNKVKFTHSVRVGPSPTLPAWGLFRWAWTPGLWPTPTPEGAAACVCWPVSRLGPGRTGQRPVTRQESRPAGPRWWWPPNCDLRRRRTTSLTGWQSSSVTGRMLFIHASWTCLLVSSEVCCTRFKHRNGSRKQHEKLLWWRTTSVLSFIIQCSRDNILKPCSKL